MAQLLIEALKGAQAEVAEQQGVRERLRRAGALGRVLAAELRAAFGLTPFGVRALRVWSALPVAATPAAAVAAAAAGAGPFGVVLCPGVAYGPQPRHKVDVYVPSHQQQKQQQEQESAGRGARVVLFVHGGVWGSGERWHFCPMATQLAAAGLVVVVPSYTLYPDALAGQMAAEVLAAYRWTAATISQYGGNPHSITVVGHSAGGHLGSLALLMLAQQKQEAAGAAVAAQKQQQQGVAAAPAQQQQCQQPPQRHGEQHQLPVQQLQERGDLAAAQAAHRHSHQQPRQQQQQPPWGEHWQASGAAGTPAPALFVGMSSVYDVARHHAFEGSRGVAGISTMARACGGAVAFDGLSPAVLLRNAAATAAAAAAATPAPAAAPAGSGARRQTEAACASGGGTDELLEGELIPLRSGLEVLQPQQHQQQQELAAPPRPAAAPAAAAAPALARSGSAGALRCPAAGVLGRLTAAAAAAHMPPCIVMSSLADHMVPWHEAAEMHLALRSCGVPSKHLIYQTASHNDFCLDWSPLATETQVLQPFARDLLAILTGRARVRFATGSTAHTATAVAALEAAAGLDRPPAPLLSRL